VAFSCIAYAEEQPDTDNPSPWEGQIELGYLKHTGNTDSESLNINLYAEYIKGRHRTSGGWKFYRLYKNNEEDKRQSTYSLQNDYKIGPKSYIYGNLNAINSKYSAYFKDYTISAGYGYQLIHTEPLTIELEIGPGYRYQKPNLDEIDDDDLIFPENVEEPIIRGNTKLIWQLNHSIKFDSQMTVVSGSSNTLTTTEINLTTSVTERFAIKFNHTRTFHSRVPNDLAKTDAASSVNILFNF
jgi:putative salt-induced outer membrane protein